MARELVSDAEAKPRFSARAVVGSCAAALLVCVASSCDSGADVRSARSAFAWDSASVPATADRSPPPRPELAAQPSERAREASSPELEAMLRDRPAMATALDGKPEMRRWLAHRFAGEDLPVKVRWDATPPQSERPAERRAKIAGSYDAEVYWREAWDQRKGRPRAN